MHYKLWFILGAIAKGPKDRDISQKQNAAATRNWK